MKFKFKFMLAQTLNDSGLSHRFPVASSRPRNRRRAASKRSRLTASRSVIDLMRATPVTNLTW
jgi:hypothetical protein